jgi:hypothetical protein
VVLGTKERSFEPIDHLTLSGLVSDDHAFRLLDRSLELDFVCDLVARSYAPTGRSLD